MKIAIAIATSDRPEILGKTLTQLLRQSRQPDAIYICTPDVEIPTLHIPCNWPSSALTKSNKLVQLTAPRGLTRQRNAMLSKLQNKFDIVTFIDDDFIPATNYLELVERDFKANSDWAVIMGHVQFDGARNAGYGFDEGLALLATASKCAASTTTVLDHVGAYGCNMSIRLETVSGTRFDERLPLYGWQEDIDFTSQLRTRGRIAGPQYLVGVHLGTRAGRSSGVRFGFSQIVNPIYLMRKGTMPRAFGIKLMSRNIAANLARSVRPEPYIDRRGRLRGNILAFWQLLHGKVEPEHILKL
ncbi:MAG: glycosyltransferase [Hyphomicrobiaceae bacterium]|nr:glycosyltransferase family 2 protein [Hyphomicrobiaceae bacterium]